eukprot:9466706-Pyramimonas_sp.AAC.1
MQSAPELTAPGWVHLQARCRAAPAKCMLRGSAVRCSSSDATAGVERSGARLGRRLHWWREGSRGDEKRTS